MNIIGHKHIFLASSGVLALASIVALSLWGLNLGIDFTGGSLLELAFADSRPSAEEARGVLAPLELGNVIIQATGERGLILRFRHIDEVTHQEIIRRLSALDPQSPAPSEKRFDTIGPTIGAQLKRRALTALGTALVAIVAYIAWAFRRVSKPVASWKYGIAAVAALIHDVLIPTGIFSVLGRFRGVEVDTLFITALLTILGFSVHDTIVVFDRTRENLGQLRRPEPYTDTVNRSVNETLTRSILTSFTVLLALGAIFLFGSPSVRYFSLALMLGIVFGTYSSIFVASPLLVIWNSLTEKR